MKRGKMNFLPWKFWFWRKIEAKKSEKCSKNWKKNKRAKNDINRTCFYNEAFQRKKEKQKKRREMAWCNGCPAAGINDNWMHTDLTHSTASRHAAMVKRAFIRARDPKHVWILNILSLRRFFFWRKSEWFFLNTFFFGSKYVPSSKKRFKRKCWKKPICFSKDFLTPFFSLEKQTPEKNDQKKKKKITRQLKK